MVVTIDTSSSRLPVSDLIFGVNHASFSSDFTRANYKFTREGGNRQSRYNWKEQASNSGVDWYFVGSSENIPSRITTARNGGAEIMLTIPMMGYVQRNATKCWGYSIAKYGNIQKEKGLV